MTGASGGVGSGIARRRGEVGAGAVVHYRCDGDGAVAVVDAMGAAGSRAIAASAELLDRAAEPTRFSALRHREPDARRLLPGYKTAGWATVLSPDASRAFVDREHLALLPHRDLLDRPSNRGIRTTPREEPMTTSLYGRGQACVPRTGGRRIRLLIRDSGHLGAHKSTSGHCLGRPSR